MIFWDSSALVALLVDEEESALRRGQLESDPTIAAWWGTAVECESALQRRLRDGTMSAADAKLARQRLAELVTAWQEVNPTAAVRKLALRLLRTHPLRAADSLQLAAALAIENAGVVGLRFACADQKLTNAAAAEGLECM